MEGGDQGLSSVFAFFRLYYVRVLPWENPEVFFKEL